MKCRVLKSGECKITQNYLANHTGIDLVGKNGELDYIVSHSDGTVIISQDGLGNLKGSTGNKSYGNFVKIKHQNGYQTLYAHMQKNLSVKEGETVQTGQTLGYMSDSGNAYGKHLHFEVWKDGVRINPTEFLNKDFPNNNNNNSKLKYEIGNFVTINGVYVSSTSTKELTPTITHGQITKIINDARNPYLLDNGNIGWVNDNCIIDEVTNITYLSNKKYKGTSIVDALKQINIDSSYNYRQKLAIKNNILNYTGTSSQNTKMLNLLKQGKLVKA